MNKLSFAFLVSILIACKPAINEVDFIIINKTSSIIDSVIITNWNNKNSLKNIKTGDSTELNLKFKDVKQNGDGSYSFFYYQNKKKYSKDFGYFSNGNPTNSEYRIEVFKDTIIVNEQVTN